MAQYGDANSEIIKREYRSAIRHPTFSCHIDLIGDISGDVLQVDVGTEVEDSLREPNYGRGTIVLSNGDGQYTDGGVPTIEEGATVKVFAGFQDENIPIWAGIVTDAKGSGVEHTMTLSVAQGGEKLRQDSTSGDMSAYNTPKLMAEYLCDRARLPVPVFQNAAGTPATATFGNTDVATNRTLWSLIHGTVLLISYVPYFDVDGVLNLVHRSTINDIDIVLDDRLLSNIQYIDDGVLISDKIINYGTSIKWGDAQFGDEAHPFQQSITKSNQYSKNRWGSHANYETDELIGTYSNAKDIALEILDWYPYRRSKYLITCPGIPQLEVFDRLLIRSEQYNIDGRFTIIGRSHHITPGSYITKDTVLSHGERL